MINSTHEVRMPIIKLSYVHTLWNRRANSAIYVWFSGLLLFAQRLGTHQQITFSAIGAYSSLLNHTAYHLSQADYASIIYF